MLDYSSYGVGCLGRTCSITHLLQFSYCRVDSSAWELLMMSFFQRKQLNVLKAAAFFADLFSISFTVKAVLLTKNWIVSWMTESKEVFFFLWELFWKHVKKVSCTDRLRCKQESARNVLCNMLPSSGSSTWCFYFESLETVLLENLPPTGFYISLKLSKISYCKDYVIFSIIC